MAVDWLVLAGRTLATESLTVPASGGGQTYTVQRGYDAADRLTSITYPDGKVVTRSYHDDGALDAVTYDGAAVIDRAYDAGNRLTTTTYGNGLVESRTYGRADNLVTAMGVPGVTDFGYTYDANKDVTAETDGILNAYAFTAGYDDQNRLTSWTRTNGDSQTWNLTDVGDWDDTTINGVLQDRTHNAVHEIETVGAAPLAHDAKGNLSREAGDTVDRYAYDFDNHLASADTDQDGAADATYSYDALGRRVSKTVGGGTYVFVNVMQGAGGQMIAEYAAGAVPTNAIQQYVYASYIDEPVMMVGVSGTRLYYHASRMFSIAAMTDSTDTVIERYTYTPYGEQTIRDASGTVRVTSIVYITTYTLGHQSLAHDEETGLTYNRARMLHPTLGRFAQRDPLSKDVPGGEYRDGYNLYQYLKSKPLGQFDPHGTCCHPCGKNECDEWTIEVRAIAGGGIILSGLTIGTYLSASEDCCMDKRRVKYAFVGFGAGISGGASASGGSTHTFSTSCLSYDDHSGIGSVASVGAALVGGVGAARVSSPYLDFTLSGVQWGLGGGFDVVLGYWAVN